MVRHFTFGLLFSLVAGLTPALASEGSAVADSIYVSAPASEWDLKSNLIYDATTSLSVGVEYGWGRRWSVDLSGSYNPWTYSGGRKWKHWLLQPELRYWTKARQTGHFIGVHLLGGVYNLNRMYLPYRHFPDTNDYRFEGWGAGIGLTYGYRWHFSERWGMEGQLGIGYVYSDYDRFCPIDCGVRLASGTHHYIGPTKVALNLIYRFGAKQRRAAQAVEAAALRRYYSSQAARDTVVVYKTVVLRDTVILRAPEQPAATVLRNEKLTLHLQYEAGSSTLLPTYKQNARELESLSLFVDRMRRDTTIVIHDIRIIGYCSIEGTAAHNNKLSYDRAQGVADYFSRRYPALSELLHVEGRGEDWDGLLRAIAEVSDLESRSRVEHIIRNVGIYEGRERQLMDLSGGRPYRRMLSDIFPQLRRIECSIDYTVRGE